MLTQPTAVEITQGSGKRLRVIRALAVYPSFWAFMGALALAALFGRATLLHLGTGIVGGDKDGYEDLWNDYWLRLALLHFHQNPFFSAWIEYPTGTSLRFHTLTPLGGLIALPLSPLVGGIAAMNLKILFALVCATFFAYLLIRDVVGSPLAAFVGAAVYTYANDQIIAEYLKGTENYLMGAALLPLYCFLLLRAATRQRWGWYGAAASLALLALALTDWQYTLFAVLFTLLYFVVAVVQRHDGRATLILLARFAAIGGAWLIVVLPTLLVPMFQEAQRSPWLELGPEQAIAHAKALVQFVRPGNENPGFVVLIITLVGLGMRWRSGEGPRDRSNVPFWAIIVAVGSVLALGPRLLLTPDRRTEIPTPYTLLMRLPLLSSGRKPDLYYASLAMLGMSVLLSIALCAWTPIVRRFAHRRLATRMTPRTVRFVSGASALLLILVILLPSLALTRQATVVTANWPPFYRDVLANDPETYAILETPLFVGEAGRGDGVYAAYQTVYDKARFGSSIARDHKADNPALFLKRATLFRDFFYLDKKVYVDLYRPPRESDFLATPAYEVMGVPLLNYYHVRYLVLYRDALRDFSPGATAAAHTLVQRILGDSTRPIYVDAEMEAYRVPDAPPLATPFFVDTGSNGWWPAEKTPQGIPYRWADTRDGKAAELLLFNLSNEQRAARVQFTAFNYQAERSITIAMNGDSADQFTLAPNESRDVTLDLTMQPGMNLLTLTSPQPPIPIATSNGRDDRLISFGLQQVRVQEPAP